MRPAVAPSQRSGLRGVPSAGERPPEPRENGAGVGADDAVGAVGDGDRPLGVLAQRQARDAERGRFLLQPARIGQDQPRVRRQAQEIDVAERLGQRSRRRATRPRPNCRSRSRVRGCTGNTTGISLRDLAHRLEDAAQRRRVVDVRRPVQRQHRVAARPSTCTRSRTRSSVASGRCRSSVSIMMLPTR